VLRAHEWKQLNGAPSTNKMLCILLKEHIHVTLDFLEESHEPLFGTMIVKKDDLAN